MKVLYIGYYKENSEWGKMTNNFILSLAEAGVEVVPRAIELGSNAEPIDAVKKLQDNNVDDCNICIQHVFPNQFVGSDKFDKNIALVTTDFVDIKNHSMVERLNQATEVWTTNNFTAEELRKYLDASIDVRVVHCPVNTNVYRQAYPKVEFPETKNDFKIYTILNNVSGRDNVLSAFHSEFDSSEPVSLVIFSSNPDQNFDQHLNKYSAQIKEMLRIKSSAEQFKTDAVIHMPNATEKDIYTLHSYGDCYVSNEHGEAWPVTAFDAMAFGSTPIIANHGGATEFLGENGTLVDCVFSTSLSNGKPSEDKNGFDYTVIPCQKQIKKAMRKAYEAWKSNPISYSNNNKKNGLQAAENFSLKQIGNKIKELINA